MSKADTSLAESPIFGYDIFIEDKIPSDIGMKKIISYNVEARTKWRDLKTEVELLNLYGKWRYNMRQDDEIDLVGQNFYNDPYESLRDTSKNNKFYDFNEQVKKMDGFNRTGAWEHKNLD